MTDFKVSRVEFFSGPNFYLGKKACVFNLYLSPEGQDKEFFLDKVEKKLPLLKGKDIKKVAELFAETALEVLSFNYLFDINLGLKKYDITRSKKNEDEYVIAIEYLDEQVTEDALHLVSEWFMALANGEEFDFDTEYKRMQSDFDKTFYGGPTLYSLIEAGEKRGIPVFYNFEENQFQWGYSKKGVRGRSTTFSTDGIKDTEFTMYKDMVKDLLLLCGLPTPVGKNCYSEDEIVEEARKLGFPVVVKPLAGHKGQGVTTGIESEEEVRKAFNNILNASKEAGASFDGAIVEQQIYGTDHRLLAVKGKFVAALERVPAYVDGNGKDTIEELVRVANLTKERADTPRSPLCKIKIDQDMIDFLQLQGKTIQYVPTEGERIELRRVANISAGGVSINVTDKIHPENIKMVENVAKFLNVTCLGIDVLAKDISKSWREGDFGVIEINAGPGVFMHLAPAMGGSIDVPSKIMESHFPEAKKSRIPIIAGNNISQEFCDLLYSELKAMKNGIGFASLTKEGVFCNSEYFCNNEAHDNNVRIILRDPKVDIAVFSHNLDDIYDFGVFHSGADVVILDDAHEDEEKVLLRELLDDGYILEIFADEIKLLKGKEKIKTVLTRDYANKEKAMLAVLKDCLPELLNKYE